MSAKIYIPSTGRPDRQVTIKSLPERWLKKTNIIVARNELESYKAFDYKANVITHPNLIGLGRIRHFICDTATSEFVILLDDDVVFYHRQGTKLINSSPYQVGEALDLMIKWLEKDTYLAETALSLSILNHHKEASIAYNEKCGPTVAIRLSAYKKLKNKFDATPMLQSDNAITMAFLTSGYRVKVSYKYAFKNVPPLPQHRNTGCSGYRTPDMERQACKLLKDLYPNYVTLREKNVDTVSDYTLYNRPIKPIFKWKRAYADTMRRK